jgi:hypothetical protein
MDMDAKLRVLKGPFSGETIQIQPGKLLIGREEDCKLRLDGNLVSPHHCVLLLDEYTLRIRDLGSKSGTIVNGKRIGKHELILLHDDTVSIAQLTFRIDLSQATDHLEIPAAEAQSFVPNALDETGLFDGDTVPLVPAEVVPASARSPAPVEPSILAGRPNADVRTNLPCAASIDSDERAATSLPSARSQPHAAHRKRSGHGVAAQAVNLTNHSAVNTQRIVKSEPKAARGTERSSKNSRSLPIRGALAITGSIAVVLLLGGGTFLLLGARQAAKYEAPQKYVQFSPKSFATMLTCEVPENWKQQFRGGKNEGPIWARFTDGQLSIEICEDLTGGAIRETVGAMRQKATPVRRDAPPADQIHEYQRQHSSEKFKSYSEEPQSRGIQTQGYGEGRISDFAATEGIFGTEVRGCRATALNQVRQFTVTCKCPPPLFEDARPVFEKVISSLGFVAVADAQQEGRQPSTSESVSR